jgi:CheY-like chemotaxis protein
VSTTTQETLPPSGVGRNEAEKRIVLVVSPDALGGALIGGLVETLGYRVRFIRPGERVADALRRERPLLAMVDAHDDVSSAALGHAQMRSVPVIVFGTPAALERTRGAFPEYRIATLEIPAPVEAVEAALQKTLADS